MYLTAQEHMDQDLIISELYKYIKENLFPYIRIIPNNIKHRYKYYFELAREYYAEDTG